MTKLTRQVLEFHRQFDHPIADSPTIPSDDRVRFRARFVVEECLELLEACFEFPPQNAMATGPSDTSMLADARAYLEIVIKNARVKVDLALAADALADIDYVVEGARLEFGINGEPIADEVHRANMAKGDCPDCGGSGKRIGLGPDPIDGKCLRCKGTGRAMIKRPDGKTLKPPGWTPPDIARELEKQRRGIGSLGSVRSYDALKEAALALPPMTPQQKFEQGLDFAYGNLAIDGKATRSAFKIIATTTVDDGLGWSEEQFDAWAADKKWDAP